VVAVTTPFKDLAIVAMSDAFVVKRTETPLSIAGFALACGTSLVYNVLNIRRREREKAQLEALDAPLIPPTSVGDGKSFSSDLDAKEKEQDQKRVLEDDQASDDGDSTWRFDDAANAAMTCCALGMLLLATAVLARLDPADVARAYSLSAA
jgi:hypothetical protein